MVLLFVVKIYVNEGVGGHSSSGSRADECGGTTEIKVPPRARGLEKNVGWNIDST